MIEARNVTVRFGRHKALDGVSLAARRGELVGVVGPAGSGKSVLLKSLCLLNRPETGEVLLEERALGRLGRVELAEVRARFGFCFQNLALFDRLDAVSNVAYVLVRRGVATAEANRRAQDQLKVVGLSGAGHKRPHELSGGMRRRLALARAMVSRPDVALFDDPFTGLDPVACARIARLIQAAHQVDGGVTVVASGDPGPLREICDRLVLLDEGKVAADLPAADFMSSGDPMVRRYLGQAVAE